MLFDYGTQNGLATRIENTLFYGLEVWAATGHQKFLVPANSPSGLITTTREFEKLGQRPRRVSKDGLRQYKGITERAANNSVRTRGVTCARFGLDI